MMRLCLVGGDVSGSPSAAMHNAALRAADIDGVYELRSLSERELPAFMAAMRAGRYAGCNVTMPHKRAVAALCDTLDEESSTLDAVNTVVVRGTTLTGANTDVAGFIRCLEIHGLTPEAGAHGVVLGSGGTAGAVVLALARLGVAAVTMVSRRPEPALRLAERVPAPLTHVPWNRAAVAAAAGSAGIVVNATPLDATELPLGVHMLPPSCTVADVRYAPRPVALVTRALAAGHRACDGLEMLLQQGMLSFTGWTGREAPVDAARAALLQAVAT